MSETLIILIRKSCNQIQMLMHISFFSDPFYFRTYLFQIHCSVNLPDRLRVGRLDSDLQLDQSRTHPADQFDFLLIQKICCHLKMKICNAFIMLRYILPDRHGMVMLTVKCPVHKFHLRHFMIDKKLQFFFYQFYLSEPETFIYGRKTVTAGKWTSSAGLIVNDPVLKIFDMFIYKGYGTQIQDRTVLSFNYFPILIPEHQTLNISELLSFL